MHEMKILQDINGKPSGKRYGGAALILNGMVLKNYLFIKGVNTLDLMSNFSNLDSSANFLIGTGAGLLGFSIAEFFKKK